MRSKWQRAQESAMRRGPQPKEIGERIAEAAEDQNAIRAAAVHADNVKNLLAARELRHQIAIARGQQPQELDLTDRQILGADKLQVDEPQAEEGKAKRVEGAKTQRLTLPKEKDEPTRFHFIKKAKEWVFGPKHTATKQTIKPTVPGALPDHTQPASAVPRLVSGIEVRITSNRILTRVMPAGSLDIARSKGFMVEWDDPSGWWIIRPADGRSTTKNEMQALRLQLGLA